MKTLYITIGILLVCAVIYYFAKRNRTIDSEPSHTAVNSDTATPKVHYTKTNTYNDLRGMALTVTAEQLHLSLPPGKTIVYGIVMDWGIDSAVATVVAYQSGDASFYMSSGGAVIGGGQHPGVNSAAKHFVSVGQTYLEKAARIDNTSLPQTDEVKFYLLTNNGTYVGQDIMKNFENNSSNWLSLFKEGNNVLTEIRLTAEK